MSRSQALDAGLSSTVISRLLIDGRWGRLDRGLYLCPDITATWLSLVWGAVLLGGTDARVAGHSAAVLHGLEEGEPAPIEVLIPFGRRVSNRPWVVFAQERNQVRNSSGRAEPPRTRVEDTVLDLCATGSSTA